MRILVVEDEVKTAQALRRGLSEEGFAVDLCGNGEEGLHLALDTPYDVIVLDVRLPGLDGVSVCRRLRNAGAETPVLLLTANTLTGQKIEGLDAGADDYLTKPFEFEELLARLRALVRRGAVPRAPLLVFADLSLDPAARTARRGRIRLDLTTKEFAILEFMMRRAEAVLTRTQILEACWDMNFESDSNIVDVHLASLRRKMEAGRRRRLIQTARGAGYVLRESE